jgi:hypothetical protein
LEFISVDLNILLIEVVGDAVASLLVSVFATDGRATLGVCGGHDGIYFPVTLSAVSVPSFLNGMLGISFPIPRGQSQLIMKTVMVSDVSDGLSDGLGGALRFDTWILLHDGEYGIIIELMNLHHVDCWRKLVSDA